MKQRKTTKNFNQPDFMQYLFEYLYRLQFRTENEYAELLNTIHTQQGRACDDQLLGVIRMRERLATVDRMVADIWAIYDFVKKNR